MEQMNEKKILERLRQEADMLTPPETLHPDAIEAMLRERGKQTHAEDIADAEVPSLRKRSKLYRYAARWGSIAAVFVLGVTVLWQSDRIAKLEENQAPLPKNAENITITQESETELLTEALTATAIPEATPAAGSGDTIEETGAAPADRGAADSSADGSSDMVRADESPEAAPDARDTDRPSEAAPDAKDTEKSPEAAEEDSAMTPATDSDAPPTEADMAAADTAKSESTAAGPSADIAEPEEAASDSDTARSESAASDSDAAEPEEAASDSDTAEPEEAAFDSDTAEPESAASGSGLASSAQSYREVYDAFKYAETYQDVYDTLHSLFGIVNTSVSRGSDKDGGMEYFDEEMVVADSAYAEASTAEAGMGSTAAQFSKNSVPGFSTTNLQELGVDEADIVKTDGAFIYVLKRDFSFAIIRADDGTLTLESTTKLDTSGLSDVSLREMYLDGDTLNVIATGRQTLLESEEDVYYTSSKSMTVLYTWDISDRANPVLAGTLNQEGSYSDSRKVGSYVYLFTSYYPVIADTYEESTIVPRINGENIPAEDFYLPGLLSEQNYLVISSIDLTHPEQTADRKVLVSGARNFYVSTENIYITNENYRTDETITEITKFHYADGEITGVAAGSVKGYLNNSFSMNEYNGCLRVVSTYNDENWEEWNALYVLDESLNQLSSIEDLGKGETIRSARFFGDTGYFVTFRQTDPLFSVDLSDPSSPQILSELKVSGFSSYLHFYGENRLLGIGYEADEDTGAVSGLKLSMFDISDPANVTEISRTVIPGITWCPAIENYKSILVDPGKNVIGFYCDNRYLVYSYDETSGSFTRELIYDFYLDDLADAAGSDTMRGLYIGDTLYLAGDTFVIPFDMNADYTKGEILLH